MIFTALRRYFVNRVWLILSVALWLTGCALPSDEGKYPRPATRPASWAQPIQVGSMDNCFQVDDALIRCEQPNTAGLQALQQRGVTHIINLRSYHDDSDEAEGLSLTLHALPMDAGQISTTELREAVSLIQSLPAPVMVHCWHGSDRTGAVVAAYRILVQGWNKPDAITEFVHGGYGFHSVYWNLVETLEQL